jgi:hypothetical protein
VRAVGGLEVNVRLLKAVEHVTADPSLHTPDLGGKATTKQVTDASAKPCGRPTTREQAMAGNRPKLPSSQGRSRSPQTSHHPPLRRAPRRERPAVLQLSGTFGPGPRRCDPALQTRPGAIRHQILSSLRRAMLAHRTRKEGGRR